MSASVAPGAVRHLFVCGAGRTGTTALGRALQSSPSIAGFAEEAKVFSEFGGIPELILCSTTQYSANRQVEARAALRDLWVRVVKGIDNGVPLTDSPLAIPAMDRLLASLPLGPWRSSRRANAMEALADFAKDLIVIAGKTTPAAIYALDHTPFTLLTSPLLSGFLCDARFIEVLRNPYQVVDSLVEQSWGPTSHAQACDWVLDYDKAAGTRRRLLGPGRFLQVRIEDLALEKSAGASAIGGFLSIELSTDDLSILDAEQTSHRRHWSGEDLELSQRKALRSVAAKWGYGA